MFIQQLNSPFLHTGLSLVAEKRFNLLKNFHVVPIICTAFECHILLSISTSAVVCRYFELTSFFLEC